MWLATFLAWCVIVLLAALTIAILIIYAHRYLR